MNMSLGMSLWTETCLQKTVITEAVILPFQVSNRNKTKRGEICSKLTIKIPERR